MRVGSGLLLADEYFFVTVDERTGRPRSHPRIAALGVAAAVLAELVIASHVQIQNEVVHVAGVHFRPVAAPSNLADAVSAGAVERLRDHPQHRDLRTWLEFLVADGVLDRVGVRLERAGLVDRVRSRTLRGTRICYYPRNPSTAAWPAIRVSQMLTGRARLTLADVVIAGLVEATGLTGHVLWEPTTAKDGSTTLTRLVDGLPASLRELLAVTRTAVGDAVLVGR